MNKRILGSITTKSLSLRGPMIHGHRKKSMERERERDDRPDI